MRFNSLIRSRCSELVSMLCAVLSCSRAMWLAAYSCSRSRKRAFSSSSALRIAHVAVEEHAHAQAQVGQQPFVQVADLGHAGVAEAAALADLLVLDVLHHALDDVADLLHVDREADDVGPAPAFALGQRLARDLRQVELDRRVQPVDRVVHARTRSASSRSLWRITGTMARSMVSTTSAWCSASRAAQLMASEGVASATLSRWCGRSLADGPCGGSSHSTSRPPAP